MRDGYRVLLLPYSVRPVLESRPDSAVMILLDWVRRLNDSGLRAVYYLALPEGSELDLGIENVFTTEVLPKSAQWRAAATALPGRLQAVFDPLRGMCPVDLALTTNQSAASVLQMFLTDPVLSPVSVPVIVLCAMGVVTGSSGYCQGRSALLLNALSAATCTSVYAYEGELYRARQLVLDYLSPALAAAFESHAYIQPWPFEPEILASRQVSERPARFRVLWTGRPNATKRFGEALGVLKRLAAVRPDVQVVVNVGSQRPLAGADCHWYEFHPVLPRDRYYALLMSCHVSLSLSRFEAGITALREQMAAGILAVVPRQPWAVDMLGSDYPLFCTGPRDAVRVLCNLLDFYEGWLEKLRPWRERAAQAVAPAEASAFMRDVVDAAASGIRRRRHRLHSDTQEHMMSFPEKEIALPNLLRRLRPTLLGSRKRLVINTPGYVHALMRGYDTLESLIPVYDLEALRDGRDRQPGG
jgi:hypothetical protein